MFLDSQNNFREQTMTALQQGQPAQLEPGYREAYAVWVAENKEVLYKLSLEEQTQSFADFLEKKVAEDLEVLISAREDLSPERKRTLTGMATRGDLLLASTDGGANFDTFLAPDEVLAQPASSYTLLSPTFATGSTDLTEVREEQMLIHVTSQLRAQHFLVQRAWIENHEVRAEVLHPKFGTYQVHVNLKRSLAMPLVYDFINAEGKKEVVETQLPEEYGQALLDATLQPVSAETAQLLEAKSAAADSGKSAQVLGATLGAVLGMEAAKRAQDAVLEAKAVMQRPLAQARENLPVPMAAKAAMKARFARQEKQENEAKDREFERYQKAREEEKKVYALKRQVQEAQAQKAKVAQKGFMKSAGVAAGAAAGGLGVLGGTGFFLTHVINLLS